MKPLKSFGSRVEEARIEARRWLGHVMTQVELAAELGIAPQTVSQWEGGAAPRSLVTIEQVARVLRVSPGWLAFGEGEMTQPVPYERQDRPPSLRVAERGKRGKA